MLSDRISRLTASGIRRVMAMALEKERGGQRVIHMEVGQPHFATPAYVIEAVGAALEEGIPGYTPNLGIPSLREAIAQRAARRIGTTVQESSVCVTSGAVMALAVAIQAVVDPGDEVLVPEPGWPNYLSAVATAGGVNVPYPLDPEDGFSLDPSRLEDRITTRTRMIIVNSPGNPTGVLADGKAIEKVLELAERDGIFVLSDEVYEDMVFRGVHHSILNNGIRDNTIYVSGASKSYAMTGWRIGWMIGPEELVEASSKLIEPLTSCPATISQIAAEAAIRGPQEFTAKMRDSYSDAFGVVDDILGPLGVIPTEPGGAFYVMIDVSRTGQSSEGFVRGLLEEKSVAVAPGSTFGTTTHGYVRLSTALSREELVRGCELIRDYLEGR